MLLNSVCIEYLMCPKTFKWPFCNCQLPVLLFNCRYLHLHFNMFLTLKETISSFLTSLQFKPVPPLTCSTHRPAHKVKQFFNRDKTCPKHHKASTLINKGVLFGSLTTAPGQAPQTIFQTPSVDPNASCYTLPVPPSPSSLSFPVPLFVLQRKCISLRSYLPDIPL